MKKIFVALALAFAAGFTSQAGVISSFSDIQYWAGTGANQSGLVIDFHDGTAQQSFVWGFRWDGSATGYDMITAIDVASVELSISSPSYITSVSFLDDQGVNHSQVNGSFAVYPADYTSWGYYIAGGAATLFDSNPPYGPIGTVNPPGGGSSIPTSWTASPSGTSDRTLADGSWDALSFGQNDASFVHQVPPSSIAYAAIPEPCTLALALLALAALVYARKRLYSH